MTTSTARPPRINQLEIAAPLPPSAPLAAAVIDHLTDPIPAHRFEVAIHPPVGRHTVVTVSGWDEIGRWHRWHCACGESATITFEDREDCDLDRAVHETGRDRP